MEREGGITEQRPTVGRHARAVGRWLSAHRPLVGAAATVVLAALTALAACVDGRSRGPAADDRAEMARAERIVDSLEQRAWMDETADRASARPALDDTGLVALGYVARARLGVGSPFRLAAFALRDPRLPTPLGRTVAWAVLARASRGAISATDSVALAFDGSGSTLPAGRQQALIDGAVDAAPDARSGEEGVRIGYALADAEGLVSGPTPAVATRLAAVARDRRLAREDAARLLRASAVDRTVDALTLLPRWRAERRFLVEQPLLGDLLRADPAAATRVGLALRDSLRAVAREVERVATADSLADPVVAPAPTTHVAGGVLPPRAARRLADLPSVRAGPPQAPVAVATAAYRRQLLRSTATQTDPTGVRRRFAERARSEETLVAELAVAEDGGARGEAPSGDVARVALAATVAMRAFAQDTLLPAALARGAGAITADGLVARFGLRAVTFDAAIPAAWRPYHLAQLAGALEDLRDVLPWVEFDGLAVRVGESAKRDSALALHDPRSRTLYLPAATGAGTIAHELAHDLDWQTARTRLAVRGTYSTDRTIRDGRGGALAVSVRGLTAARPRAASGGDRSSERPAELFARGVDWFVATALAANGRMNGALSAVQDESLAGYAGVQPPTAGDGAADALVGVLADMTVVPASTRGWFLDRYGSDGAAQPGPLALVRAAAGGWPRGGTERLLRTVGLLGASCVGQPAAGSWRVQLVRAAAESRARGMLRARGRRWVAPARWSWEAHAVVGGPWNPALGDSAVARTRDALLRAAQWEDAARNPLGGGVVGGLAAQARSCR